ncbi:MAG: hypothetical protein QOE98_2310 [Gaiellaceae bacterium]|nr:hypothetical protein [Gaiellaceae bacterium]
MTRIAVAGARPRSAASRRARSVEQPDVPAADIREAFRPLRVS